MRVLVLGGTGMLGHKLVQVLSPGMDVWTTIKGRFEHFEGYRLCSEAQTITGVDASDFLSVRNAIERVQPDAVINCIGVIKQLPSVQNVVTTLTINSIFVHRLAELAENLGFRLVSVSTDCVFDGARGNYSETDLPNALDLYGTSKRLGEVTGMNCLTLRTSIIGRELMTAHSLVEWFVSNRGGSVDGYVNAIYTGFPTIVFAQIIKEILLKHPSLSGLYNVSSDEINKYELLQLINQKFNLNIEVRPFYDFTIDRSLNSEKFRSETGMDFSTWDRMLDEMALDPTPYARWRENQ